MSEKIYDSEADTSSLDLSTLSDEENDDSQQYEELDGEIDIEEINDDDTTSKKNLLNYDILISKDLSYNDYYKKKKVTKPFLTKYEKAKILGLRAQMLSNGSIPMIETKYLINITKTLDIAEMELKEKKIPLFIRRYLPNKEYEDWRLDELIIN